MADSISMRRENNEQEASEDLVNMGSENNEQDASENLVELVPPCLNPEQVLLWQANYVAPKF